MSYLGQVELKSSEIRRVDVTGSTSATHTLTWTPASEQSLIITINGIKQQNNYSISGVTLTLDDALLSDDKMEVIGILDIGEATIPPDDSITTAMVKDDAIDADKLANSINTEIAANTAKVTNATHTGDVTGATGLTIAANAVNLAKLEDGTQGDILYYGASGAPARLGFGTSGDFLKTQGTGANPAWASIPAGGLTEADCWRLTTGFTGDAAPIASNWERDDSYGFGLLGTGMTESSGIFSFPSTGYWVVSCFGRWAIAGDDRGMSIECWVTLNDSAYSRATRGSAFIQQTSGDNTIASATATKILDVTDLANIKVQFRSEVTNSSTLTNGSSTINYTYATFMKLGAT